MPEHFILHVNLFTTTLKTINITHKHATKSRKLKIFSAWRGNYSNDRCEYKRSILNFLQSDEKPSKQRLTKPSEYIPSLD